MKNLISKILYWLYQNSQGDPIIAAALAWLIIFAALGLATIITFLIIIQ